MTSFIILVEIGLNHSIVVPPIVIREFSAEINFMCDNNEAFERVRVLT